MLFDPHLEPWRPSPLPGTVYLRIMMVKGYSSFPKTELHLSNVNRPIYRAFKVDFQWRCVYHL